MLTEYDVSWMQDSVRDIISMWNTKISIYSKLPIDKQPHYNKLMKEFDGNVVVDLLVIDAERKDIVNNMTNAPDNDNTDYGIKNEGTLLYAIPDVITKESGDIMDYKPSVFDVVKVDESGDLYFIRNIRDRIGETLITIKRFTGTEYSISKNPDNTYSISGYGWQGE